MPDAIVRSTLASFGRDLSAATDWAIANITAITGGNLSINADTGGMYSVARDNERYWKDQKHVLEEIVETAKEGIKTALEASDLDGCAGTIGAFKLSSGAGSLKTVFKTDKKTLGNVVNADEIKLLSIPAKYLTLTTLFTLNTDILKDDIEAGRFECPWATVEKSRRLTIDKKQVKLCPTNS